MVRFITKKEHYQTVTLCDNDTSFQTVDFTKKVFLGYPVIFLHFYIRTTCGSPKLALPHSISIVFTPLSLLLLHVLHNYIKNNNFIVE